MLVETAALASSGVVFLSSFFLPYKVVLYIYIGTGNLMLLKKKKKAMFQKVFWFLCLIFISFILHTDSLIDCQGLAYLTQGEEPSVVFIDGFNQ